MSAIVPVPRKAYHFFTSRGTVTEPRGGSDPRDQVILKNEEERF